MPDWFRSSLGDEVVPSDSLILRQIVEHTDAVIGESVRKGALRVVTGGVMLVATVVMTYAQLTQRLTANELALRNLEGVVNDMERRRESEFKETIEFRAEVREQLARIEALLSERKEK